jgi:hypothetical protein
VEVVEEVEVVVVVEGAVVVEEEAAEKTFCTYFDLISVFWQALGTHSRWNLPFLSNECQCHPPLQSERRDILPFHDSLWLHICLPCKPCVIIGGTVQTLGYSLVEDELGLPT